MIYDEFGGQHDDLFIYDRNGRLFAYLPSTRTAEVIGGPSVLLSTTQDVTTHAGTWRPVAGDPRRRIHPRCGTSRQNGLWSRMSGLSSHTSRVSAASMRLIHLEARSEGVPTLRHVAGAGALLALAAIGIARLVWGRRKKNYSAGPDAIAWSQL